MIFGGSFSIRFLLWLAVGEPTFGCSAFFFASETKENATRFEV